MPARSDSPAQRLLDLWSEGPPPDLRAFLDQAGVLAPTELLEVLRVDQQERWEAGEPIPAHAYLQGNPDLRADPEHACELIYAEYLLREESGESPILEEYLSDYPEYADRLRQQIEFHRALSPGATVAAGGEAGETATATVHPDFIGRYQVIEVLDDQSGQATVYRVLHPTLREEQALKLSRKPLGKDPTERHALLEEARLLKELPKNPHLVRVLDFDFHDDRPFLVMEYVRGCNLEQFAKRNRATSRQSAALASKLARVLALVHHRGVIHYDIKPKNVLIDEAGEPRLIDFGMGRIRHAWTDVLDPPSGGTLAFMAPEQARALASGGAREVVPPGPACDIFALGGVLYYLLTGRVPFEGETIAEQLDRACRCDFDGSALRVASVPRRLTQVCLRAMAADPADRCAAEDLATALEGYVRGPRRRVAFTAVGAVLLAAGTLTIAARTVFSSQPKVVAMDVVVHRRNPAEYIGQIGLKTFAGRYNDDDVRVHVKLDRPAFAVLLALNPDGSTQLCYPPDEATPPARITELDYPPDPTEGFGLTDGVGLQAFVVVASRHPLPPYREWRSRLGPLPWKKATADHGWWYDGREFRPLDEGQVRGKPRGLADRPKTFAAACRTLQSMPDVEAIRAVAFPVLP